MKTHKLMVKTHNVTGLKYLCYTRSEGSQYANYKGSGTYWKKHLQKYGDSIRTELIFETVSLDEFKKVALQKSHEYDVVKSREWANQKPEEGDGGNTVSNRRWITDGFQDKYIFKDEEIAEGWKPGRSKCIFNNREKQIEFSKRCDTKLRGAQIKKAWDSGKFEKRDHSKCGVSGFANPAKRPDVKAKISNAFTDDRRKEYSERMKRNQVWKK